MFEKIMYSQRVISNTVCMLVYLNLCLEKQGRKHNKYWFIAVSYSH